MDWQQQRHPGAEQSGVTVPRRLTASTQSTPKVFKTVKMHISVICVSPGEHALFVRRPDISLNFSICILVILPFFPIHIYLYVYLSSPLCTWWPNRVLKGIYDPPGFPPKHNILFENNVCSLSSYLIGTFLKNYK